MAERTDQEYDDLAYALDAAERRLEALPDLQTAVDAAAIGEAKSVGLEWSSLTPMQQYAFREVVRRTLVNAGVAEHLRVAP